MKKLWLLVAVGIVITSFVIFYRPTERVPPIVFPNEACKKFYTGIYARESVDVRFIFGYKDARPARFVADRYEYALAIQDLLAPCSAERNDCGFAVDADSPDGERLAKIIRGPDGKKKKILLSVVHSSVGPDDVSNRTNPFQKWQSEYARENFLEGIKSADIVFYNGHSRLGGGPSFEPPNLDSTEHVDYNWYKKNQPGFALLLRALADSKHLCIFGLFSCSSTQHFSERIERTRPGLRLITSGKPIYFSEALRNAQTALSDLLGMKCKAPLF